MRDRSKSAWEINPTRSWVTSCQRDGMEGREGGLEVTGLSAPGTAAKHLLSHCNCFRLPSCCALLATIFLPQLTALSPLLRFAAPFFPFIFSSIFLSRISFVRLLSFGFSRSFVSPENGLGLSSSVCQSLHLSVCLSVCLSPCLSVCCSVCLRRLLPMQARGASTCVNMRLCPQPDPRPLNLTWPPNPATLCQCSLLSCYARAPCEPLFSATSPSWDDDLCALNKSDAPALESAIEASHFSFSLSPFLFLNK